MADSRRGIAHARSGNKGDRSNIGLIALKPDYYPILLRGTGHCKPRQRAFPRDLPRPGGAIRDCRI